MTPAEKLDTWCALADALGKRPRETLARAALRAMGRRSPYWAAAQVIVRADKLRNDEAWSALARARALLPGGKP
jgi:hypothetical protein